MNNKGFTLVEVVVVSVIVALLASTAILLYNGYIQDSARDTVEEMAGVAASSANAYFRRTGSDPDSADLNLFIADPTRYTVNVTSSDVIVNDTKYSVSDTAGYK